MKIVSAYQMKAAVMWYYRFNRQLICAPEIAIGSGIADCITYDGHGIHEIEIKMSKYDLYAGEERKKKHNYYAEGQHKYFSVPNAFSVCVPVALEEVAKEWVAKTNKKYGVIRVDDRSWIHDAVSIAKTARSLHTRPMHKYGYSIMRKLSSMVIRDYSMQYWKEPKK